MEKLADISAFTELENGGGISSCFNWDPAPLKPPRITQRRPYKPNPTSLVGRFGRVIDQSMAKYQQNKIERQQKYSDWFGGPTGDWSQIPDPQADELVTKFTQDANALRSYIGYAYQKKDFQRGFKAVDTVARSLRMLAQLLVKQMRSAG